MVLDFGLTANGLFSNSELVGDGMGGSVQQITVNTTIPPNSIWFGTGVDGDIIISSNTTLTTNKNYANLTVNAGVTLTVNNGLSLRVSNVLRVLGTIKSGAGSIGEASTSRATGATTGAGGNAGGCIYVGCAVLSGTGTIIATGGTGGNATPMTATWAGGNGVDGAGGVNGSIWYGLFTNTTSRGRFSGGGTAAAAGAGGATSTAMTFDTTQMLNVMDIWCRIGIPASGARGSFGRSDTASSAKGGGGGGGGGAYLVAGGAGGNGGNVGAATANASAGAGGGGGGGGGHLRIAVGKYESLTGFTFISAGGPGGNGCSASVASDGAGGGGGGGAGGVIVYCAPNNTSVTVSVAGGAKGTKGTTGNAAQDGVAGTAGTIVYLGPVG